MRAFSTVYVLLGALILFLIWANVFELDETVRARGKIETEGRAQVVQSPEGGVLRALMVREGDMVQLGEVLALMDAQVARATVDEVYAEIQSNELAKIRAMSELSGETPDFGELSELFPSVAAAQLALFDERMDARATEENYALQNVEVAERELEIQNTLFQSGDVSRSEVARAERDLINARSDFANVTSKFRSNALQDIASIEQEIAVLNFRLEARRTALGFTELTAPQNGIVTEVSINTLGGVLRPGDELLRISPTGMQLVPEVRFAPMDVGNLKVGQTVMVQFDAFPSTIFGAVSATLTHISADTITDTSPNGQTETFYLGKLVFDDTQENERIQLSSVRPGMEITVDVKTGKRTVMTYLAKPILRAFSGALREP